MLDNAEQHAASRITVGSHESADMAVLTVSDDGPGIAPEHAEPVFQRLGRIDTARSASTGGTRLGLAITREIVRRHG